MLIRPAGKYDLVAISVLWEKMAREEHGDEIRPDRTAWLSIINCRFECDPYFFVYLAEIVTDNVTDVVGFIMGHVFYEPDDSEIHGLSHHIYVCPEYRNTGVSIGLYHTLAKEMRKKGVKVMSLNCIPSKTDFWAKKGFIPTVTTFSKKL
jgi:GNAT superfamily N-acetyltransferase